METDESSRAKTSKRSEGNGEKNVRVKLRDKKRSSWIREQTEVEDILVTIKKKLSWAGHVLHRPDNRWTTKLTEWQPRDGRRNQGRQKTRWGDEIKKFAGANWNILMANRDGWKQIGEAFTMQWVQHG